jgi:hypothetical protein
MDEKNGLVKKPLSPNFSFCEKKNSSSWMKKIGLVKKPLSPNFSFCEKRDLTISLKPHQVP